MDSDWHRNLFKVALKKSIEKFELDLTDKAVLTEAASEVFKCTPLIAALAGAESVTCLGQNSKYGKFTDISKNIKLIASEMNIDTDIFEFVDYSKHSSLSNKYDIVTNLGFVRPIDNKIIKSTKKNSVIALMCELWEVRNSDVDFKSAIDHNCQLVSINEQHPLIDLFSKIPLICFKKLIDENLDPTTQDIFLLGNQNWGTHIKQFFAKVDNKVTNLGIEKAFEYSRPQRLDLLSSHDIIIVDSYPDDFVLGTERPKKPFSFEEFQAIEPTPMLVLQLKGGVNEKLSSLDQLKLLPDPPTKKDTMAFTVQEVGLKPVINLHAGGLKTAEIVIEHSDCDHDLIDQIIRSHDDLREVFYGE